MSDGNYGQGGGYNEYWGRTSTAATGGSGGFNSDYVSVTPGTSYNIKVGAGGEPDGRTMLGGASGFVLLAYGGDI